MTSKVAWSVDSMPLPGASLAEARAKPREVMPSPQFSEGARFLCLNVPFSLQRFGIFCRQAAVDTSTC